MSFLFFVVRKLALLVPTLFGVSVIGFLLACLLPGNPALVKAGPMATPQYIAEMKQKMGLDQPLHVQYGRYVTGLLHGDLGESSATGRPVLTDFMQRLPATLELTMASLFLAIFLGVPLGVLCAVHRDTIIDHFGRVFSVAGVAMPSFWTGLILIYVFFYLLGVAPAPSRRLHHVPRAVQVGVDDGVPALDAEIDRRLRKLPARAVDEEIEPPAHRPNPIKHRSDLLRLPDVGDLAGRGKPAAAHGLDEPVELGSSSSGDDDMRAEPREQPGNSAADASRPAGDECGLTREGVRREDGRPLGERGVVEPEGGFRASPGHDRACPSAARP